MIYHIAILLEICSTISALSDWRNLTISPVMAKFNKFANNTHENTISCDGEIVRFRQYVKFYLFFIIAQWA